MERYDYEHEVRSDLKQWLKDEYFPYKGIESADDMTRRRAMKRRGPTGLR